MPECRLAATKEPLALPGCRDCPASWIALEYMFMPLATCHLYPLHKWQPQKTPSCPYWAYMRGPICCRHAFAGTFSCKPQQSGLALPSVSGTECCAWCMQARWLSPASPQ